MPKKIEESGILCIGPTAGAPGRKNTPATRPPRPVVRMPGDHIPGLRPARAIVPGRAGRLELGGVEDASLRHEDIAARHLAHYDGLGELVVPADFGGFVRKGCQNPHLALTLQCT